MIRLPNPSGPFWDGVHGRTPMPPAAATLGLQFIDIDAERGTIELAFEATKDFTNPMGNVLGAFLAAMLYDTVGPALLATLDANQFQSTLDINVEIPPRGSSWSTRREGRVRHRADDIAFLEVSLHDANNSTIAVATATARVIPLARASGAV